MKTNKKAPKVETISIYKFLRRIPDENTAQGLFPTEIVASVLPNLPPGKKHIPTELRKIHLVFFMMRSQCKNIMKAFDFDKRGTFVYSHSLDQAFSNLETSKVLSRTNPNLDNFEVTKALGKYYRERVKDKLNKEQLNEIKLIAKELSKIS